MQRMSPTRESNTAWEILRHFRQFLSLDIGELRAAGQQTISEWIDDKAPRLGASLAFYTLLSLAPLLVVIVAVAAFAFGEKAAQGQLIWEIQDLVGAEGAKTIQGLVQAAYKPGTGALATFFSIVTLAVGATSVVVELHDALNTIWHVAATTGSGVVSVIKQRFYSFALILGVGFLLLVSLVLSAWIAAMGRFLESFLPLPESALHIGTSVLSFCVITFLFAAIYKLVPDVHLKWTDVIIGASVTSLVFTVGKLLIGLYLGKVSFGSTYGAAGSLVMVIVWVYYSAQLFFLGAEFTKVYTQRYGSHFANKLAPTPVPTPVKSEPVVLKPSTRPAEPSSDKDEKVKLIS